MRDSIFISQGGEGDRDMLGPLKLKIFTGEEQLSQKTEHHRGSSWPVDGGIQILSGVSVQWPVQGYKVPLVV